MTSSISKPTIIAGALSRALKEKAGQVAHNLDSDERRRAWTDAIKTVLEEEACKYDCEPWPRKKPRRPQFLLDFVWWRNKNQGALIGVESEWGNPSQVDDDFWKLLCFKADLKVLIYTASDKTRPRILKQILKDIEDFDQHRKGECYLFVEFSPGKKCYRYKYPVLRSGKCVKPKLIALDPESKNAM